MKRYYLKTQKDYDNLMSELEKQGYTWSNGENPTGTNLWTDYGKNTYVLVCETNKRIRYGGAEYEVVQYGTEKVTVPQFVADWYEQYKEGYTLYGILSELTDEYYYSIGKLDEWIRSVNNARNDDGLANVQEIVAKMYLHGYEVEKEKKYYWRKKKEYLLDFEDPLYLMTWSIDSKIYYEFSPIIDIDNYEHEFTESELAKDLGDDINKLERVEIDNGKSIDTTVCR